jgi:ribonuclease HII
MSFPTFHRERELIGQGYRMIVGVDEVGSGALAGPVFAGAVVLPLDSRLGGIRDSKLLSAAAREDLYPLIIERAAAWAVGSATVEEIHAVGIRQATLLAMRRAVESIAGADYVLVDAWKIPGISLPQNGIIRGDRFVKSIAAASIVAKVERDRVMAALAEVYPQYGFEVHKGYATSTHRAAIKEHGACPIHRVGYRTFREYLAYQS